MSGNKVGKLFILEYIDNSMKEYADNRIGLVLKKHSIK